MDYKRKNCMTPDKAVEMTKDENNTPAMEETIELKEDTLEDVLGGAAPILIPKN